MVAAGELEDELSWRQFRRWRMKRPWAVARSGMEVTAVQRGGANGRGGGQWRILLLGRAREPRRGSARDEVGKGVQWRRGEDGVSRAAQVGGPGVAGCGGDGRRRAALPVQSVGGRRRREKEEREGEIKRKEKWKKEKGKGKKKNGERERERELSVGFAAAVGHARAAAFGRSATRTRNERKGKGIGRRLVLVSGRQIAGT